MTISIKSWLFILVIASLAIIIMICAIIIGRKSRQMQMIAKPHSTNKSFDWCLPCEVLTNSSMPALFETLNKTLVGDEQHFCAHYKEQATLLLELMSSTAVKEVLKTFDAGNLALSKASAHQRLRVSPFLGIVEFLLPEENVILEFDKTEQDPLIDYARNITLMQSDMVVQLLGRYYIYSSIFFEPDSSQPCGELPKQRWEHNIALSRSKGTTYEIIFSTTYTCCDTCVKHKKTSYTGGLFDLKENDRLHVVVSSVGGICFRKEGSYFGLFMLE